MYLRKITHPRIARCRDGSILSLSDLPTGTDIRWIARRKAAVVYAIDLGLLAEEEALERYQITEAELDLWRKECDHARLPIPTGSALAYSRGAHLTRQERVLYSMLLGRPGKLVRRFEILNALCAGKRPLDEGIVNVLVCRLRAKLPSLKGAEGVRIETVWGRGYRLVQEAVSLDCAS